MTIAVDLALSLYYTVFEVMGLVFPRMRDLREDSDLSQAKVAKILNVDQRTYSHYETGDRAVPVEVIIKLAKYYEVSTDYILGISDKRQQWPGR